MFCRACASPLRSGNGVCARCGAPTDLRAETIQDAAAVIDRAPESLRGMPPAYVARLLYLLPILLLLIGTATLGVRAVTRHQAEVDAYQLATEALTEGRLLDARRQFEAAGDYADAANQAAAVRAMIAPYATQYSDGVLALKRGDFEAAITAFASVARDLPDYEQVTSLLEQARQGRLSSLSAQADSAIAQARWSDAEHLLATIASESPDDPEIRNRLLSLQREHAAYVFSLKSALYLGHPGEIEPTLITDEISVAWPVWSPDRTRIAFINPGDQRNGYVRSLYVINADGSGLRKAAENPARWRAPLWSPDGTKIAFEIDGPSDGDPTGEVTVKIADLLTGDVSDLIGDESPNAMSPAWSPHGDRIAFVVRMPAKLEQDAQVPDAIRRMTISAVYVKNFATGKITVAAQGLIPDPWRITWSPTSEELLVFTRPDGTSFRRGGLYHLDLATDTIYPIDLMSIDVSLPVWSPDGRWFAYVVRSNEIRVVAADGSMQSVLSSAVLSGLITWSPSADRLIALGNPSAGGSAMVDLLDSGIQVDEVDIEYDADGGDAGPPEWSPSHPALPAGITTLNTPVPDSSG